MAAGGTLNGLTAGVATEEGNRRLGSGRRVLPGLAPSCVDGGSSPMQSNIPKSLWDLVKGLPQLGDQDRLPSTCPTGVLQLPLGGACTVPRTADDRSRWVLITRPCAAQARPTSAGSRGMSREKVMAPLV